MKPPVLETHFQTGTQTERFGYKIAKGEGERHVMKILQKDLYRDPILAFIREIITNAFDSHLRALVFRKINVTLPTELNPRWTCTDYGTGMSRQDLDDFYATLGGSGSRDLDDTIGMLGLGAKAPQAYCVSFVVTATKDGFTTVAEIAKDHDGVGTVIPLSTEFTGKPNGVTVSIPVQPRDIDAVRQKTKEFLFYWRDKSVLIDGEEPDTIDDTDEYVQVDPDIYLPVKDTYSSKSIVVMGNVPYEVDSWFEGKRHKRVVAFVPNGSVHFTPSRENLQMTDFRDAVPYRPSTTETLESMWDYADDAWVRHLKTSAQGLNDWEQLKFWATIPRSLMRESNVTWRSIGIDVDLDLGRTAWQVSSEWNNSENAGRQFKSHWLVEKRTLVVNFPYKRVSKTHRESLKQHGVEAPYVLIPDTWKIDLSTFPPGRYVDWTTVPRIKQSRSSNGTGSKEPREKTKYQYWINGRHEWAEEITGDARIVYETGGKDDYHQLTKLSGMYRTIRFVLIYKKQVNRFRRLHPNSITLSEFTREKRESSKNAMTAVEYQWLGADYQFKELTRRFEPYLDELDHKFRKRLLKMPSLNVINEFTMFNHNGWDQTIRDNTRNEMTQLLDDYPLLQCMQAYSCDSTKMEDLVFYINAKAKEKQ